MSDKLKAILDELRRDLKGLYGDRLARLILFGSQARGDAAPDSDIDILLVFKEPFERHREHERVINITAALSLAYDMVISCLYMPEERFLHENSSLLRNIRKEGVSL